MFAESLPWGSFYPLKTTRDKILSGSFRHIPKPIPSDDAKNHSASRLHHLLSLFLHILLPPRSDLVDAPDFRKGLLVSQLVAYEIGPPFYQFRIFISFASIHSYRWKAYGDCSYSFPAGFSDYRCNPIGPFNRLSPAHGNTGFAHLFQFQFQFGLCGNRLLGKRF